MSMSTPRRTLRRAEPKRSPLQEQSPSKTNEGTGKKSGKLELADEDIFAATPFPTKPQHVLLPSTIRKQRSVQNSENEMPMFLFNHSQPELARAHSRGRREREARRMRRAPNLQLKRSVSALRDMYEAQAESSRPSTAVRSRPSTAAPSPNSRPKSRMRRTSSAEALPVRITWDTYATLQETEDEVGALPTLTEHISRLDSDQSFASRIRGQVGSSSPNFLTYGSTSPELPAFTEEAEATSSPEFSHLQDNSVIHHLPEQDPFTSEQLNQDIYSSPNFQKLGTSSPQRSSSPTPSIASTTSMKRKRPVTDGAAYAGSTPLFFMGRHTRRSSSPIVRLPAPGSEGSLQSGSQILASSPPEIGSGNTDIGQASSPVFRVLGRSSVDRSSLVSAHTTLQSVLSSSPAPLPQQPVVRAPNVHQFEIMANQKRIFNNVTGAEAPLQRLSPVPSVSNVEIHQVSSTDFPTHRTRYGSTDSAYTSQLDDELNSDEMGPAQAYMVHHNLNSSQERIISEADMHEAADELSALPREHPMFPELVHKRSATYLSPSTSNPSLARLDSFCSSMEERLHSMRSFVHGRADSMRSNYRPGSAASYMSTVPTWARHYYGGFYRDSFNYLYQSNNDLGYSHTQVQPVSRRSTMPASSGFETIDEDTNSNTFQRRASTPSLRTSLRNFVPAIILPLVRPRLNARQSHQTAGVGPLVSNPVRPVSEMLSRPPSAYVKQRKARHVSMPLSAVDPRFHWQGITEDVAFMPIPPSRGTPVTPTFARALPAIPTESQHQRAPHMLRLSTPHLHHDRRLHTGSSKSNGYGAPYNIRSRWQPAEPQTDELGSEAWFKIDRRDAQVVCFMTGFLCPLTWIVASFLPLPQRPHKFDPEKMEHHRSLDGYPPDWDEVDVLAKLRLERHLRGLEELRWQNARWWQRMNRWMSCVGLVVLVIIIILAIIGTRGNL